MFIERDVRSLEETLQAVMEIRAFWLASPTAQEEVWFRGVPKRTYRLLPGLYRPDVISLRYLEPSMFERFKALAAPLVRREPANDWEWYFLAQHHHFRTRLLDWTENLLAAVHFALYEKMKDITKVQLAEELSKPVAPPIFDEHSPAIWIMDAGSLNEVAFGPEWDDVLVVGYPGVNKYLPDNIAEHPEIENEKPIALLSPRSNERIVAQQGCFTVHGHSKVAIEDLGGTPPLKLARVTFDRANLGRVWRELETCGTHCLSLFPDLDRVSERVLWMCQNEAPASTA